MMALMKLWLAVLAAWSALNQDEASALCLCTRQYFSLCQKLDIADAVVHGTVLSRNVAGDNATYTLGIITLYKAEDNVAYSDEISFNTAASSDDCGVTLTIGGGYLVGLRDSNEDGIYKVSACHGLYELWSTYVEEEVAEC